MTSCQLYSLPLYSFKSNSSIKCHVFDISEVKTTKLTTHNFFYLCDFFVLFSPCYVKVVQFVTDTSGEGVFYNERVSSLNADSLLEKRLPSLQWDY